MKKLAIDECLFFEAFGADAGFQAYPHSMFLDLELGGIEFVFEEDFDAEMDGMDPEENKAKKKRIETEPDRFLYIPGLQHGEHHDILKQFLASDWTDNVSMRNFAEGAYFGSIGGWKKTVNDDYIFNAYKDYRDKKLLEMAEKLLLENGVEADWK